MRKQKMKTFYLYAKVTGTKYIGEIEAESKAAAIEKADRHPNAHISLCHHCSAQVEDAEIEDITVEEKQ